MKYEDLKVGQRVVDGFETGIVEEILKTRVKIRFFTGDKLVTYDKPHLQFLKLIEND